MNDRALIRTGVVGATVAAVCCATPVLAVLLPVLGLGAWLSGADWVLFPLLAASVGLIAWGVYRRRARAACRETETHGEGVKP